MVEDKRFKLKKVNGKLAIYDEIRGYSAPLSEDGASTLLYWLNDLNE